MFGFVQNLITIKVKLKSGTFISALIVVFFLSDSKVFSQDIHFSQYLSSPFNLNPSLTGDFKGDYRVIGNYRNQWNAITVPYKTFGVAGDMRNLAEIRNLSAGLSVYSDEAGDSRMNTLIIQMAGSYGYPLTLDSAHSIYFGLMPSFIRQQFNYSDLTFDNQYDIQRGIHDPGIPSGEFQNNESLNYFDLSTGIRWNYTIAPRHKIDAGFSIFHLLNTNKYYTENQKSSLRRYNIHANYQIKVWEKIDLLPGILYIEQGENNSTILGTSSRYIYNSSTVFHAGLWYRNQDAMFVNIGLTYQTLYLGFSYDINTSELNQASHGQGAYELSIIYVFQKFKPNKGKYLSCPNYL